MKKVAGLLIAVLLLSSIYTVSAANEITIFVNGSRLDSDVAPVITNGRTLVPLRVIFEALGASVDWDNDTKTVTANTDDVTISLQIGSNVLFKNGKPVVLDVPAQIASGRTLVPVRAVAESLGADVAWDEQTRTVNVNLFGETEEEDDSWGGFETESPEAGTSLYDDYEDYGVERDDDVIGGGWSDWGDWGDSDDSDEIPSSSTADDYSDDTSYNVSNNKNQKTVVPVTSITGVVRCIGDVSSVSLSSATVNPGNATNRTITWSIVEIKDKSVKATISGNSVVTSGIGNFTMRATVKNGLADGIDFTRDYHVVVGYGVFNWIYGPNYESLADYE